MVGWLCPATRCPLNCSLSPPPQEAMEENLRCWDKNSKVSYQLQSHKKHTRKNLTEFIVNYITSWIVSKKGKNDNTLLRFSSGSISFLHSQHYLPLPPTPWGKGELQV